jgi:serpin B
MPENRSWLRTLLGSSADSADGGPSQGPASVGEANNEFAFAMFRQLRTRAGNIFFSPFSIRTALSMAHAGARGETARQMGVALGISASDESSRTEPLEPAEQAAGNKAGPYELAIANALWGQDGAPLDAGFRNLIAARYDGIVELVDFARASEAARATINLWVEERTRQKIRDLIPAGGLTSDTRLVLANAVYFKGAWERKFRKAATRDDTFHLGGSGTVQAPLMNQQAPVPYVQGKGFQAIDLGYEGGDLSMLVFLPDANDGLTGLEKAMSATVVRDCTVSMARREVQIFLPRFKVTWGTVNLSEMLAALGISFAFDRDKADFSGINVARPPQDEALSLSAVFHKAFAEVNEAGTEAAAATAVTISLGSSAPVNRPVPIPVFRADHPFIFAIRDRRSGAILFLGRLADPTRES